MTIPLQRSIAAARAATCFIPIPTVLFYIITTHKLMRSILNLELLIESAVENSPVVDGWDNQIVVASERVK